MITNDGLPAKPEITAVVARPERGPSHSVAHYESAEAPL